MTASPAAEAARVLDALGVRWHGPIEIDGTAVEATLAPADGEQLADALAQLSEHRLAAIIRGGGSRMALGNPPRSADLFLSTEALTGVDEFDSEDGVLHARAGTRLAEIRERVGADGWELPIDAPGEKTTLGGALATGATGPRRHGFGPVRDWVLGLEVVLSTGERTRCGGRVVKNVTGYDLAKLYTGSLGTLGVIEGVWLRLRPKPEATRLLRAAVTPDQQGFVQAREATLRTSARCVALLCPRAAAACGASNLSSASPASPGNPGTWQILLEFAGDAPAVTRDAEWWLESMPAAAEADAGALDELRSLQGSVLEPGGLRARVAMLPSQLAGASRALAGSVAAQVLYPGPGLLYAYSEAGSAKLDRAANSCAGLVCAEQGYRASVVLEDLPAEAKSGRDVFGEPGPDWRLMKALKQRFDPGGVLNPGRFLGGI
ncbi:MAG: FAD-binding oxidoreductase [Myxococcota bacterium]